MDVKVTKDCYIPKEEIKLYVAYSSAPIIRDVRKRKEEGTIFDMTCGKKALCVIYLKSGDAVLVNTAPATIRARMEAAE